MLGCRARGPGAILVQANAGDAAPVMGHYAVRQGSQGAFYCSRKQGWQPGVLSELAGLPLAE
jgi:hypothetical protein